MRCRDPRRRSSALPIGIACISLSTGNAGAGASRVANRAWSVMEESRVQHPARLALVGWCHDYDVRQAAQTGHVIRAGVRGPVAADDTRAVDREHHREVLQHDIVDDLVIRTLEKRRVDRDDGLESLASEACRERDAVLLGNGDVEIPIGVELFESLHLRPLAHRGGDRDESRVTLRHVAEPVSEDLGICRPHRCRTRHDSRTAGSNGDPMP